MTNVAEILPFFESLGDNCEFGFVQRFYGLEPGGLLRWAISNPEPLICALSERFEELYSYENLIPSSDDMVLDGQYGLFFHTKMHSQILDGARQFMSSESERLIVYKEEAQKIRYLVNKLLNDLDRGEKIFVYKRNIGFDKNTAILLQEALQRYNYKNKLLVATLGNGDESGSITVDDHGILYGFIDRFAPYEQATDVSYAAWEKICVGVFDILSKPISLPKRISFENLP